MSRKEWSMFVFISLVFFCVWFKFGYPQFKIVDLSIGKKQAQDIAGEYLSSRGFDLKGFSKAIVFETNEWADRYLQRTLGLKSEEEFIGEHDYELFYWRVRFFKELKKEEYTVEVSSKTGGVLGFAHLIEDTEPRDMIDKDIARQRAEEFLSSAQGLDLKDYDFHEEKIKRYDNRIDYSFSWEKSGVYIPWNKDQGLAKLLMGVTISGNEIRQFYKGSLDIPEKFKRYIQNQLVFGEYLSSFGFLLFIFLLASSGYVIVKRRNNMVIRICKKWFVYLAVFIIIINVLYILNNMQSLIIAYPTSTYLASFIGIYFVKVITGLIFIALSFTLPAFSGESLRNEVFPKNTYGSFLHYIKSTFFSRQIAKSIVFGYLLFVIMLGLQAAIFNFGHRYFGVWREWISLAQLSSAYFPFAGAFIIAFTASFSEELIYRLFGISWFKKCFRKTILAVLFTSLIWGLGHAAYAIFPVWFRAIEITIIGLLFGFIFVKYGLIPLVVAHYLFDVFWGTAAYVLGRSSSYLFISSLSVLALPIAFAAIAYYANREDKEREIHVMLNATEEYNLKILISFISARKSQGIDARVIKNELLLHNWDVSLVDLAIYEVFKSLHV
ncbi:MAG: type II CAAX endopeptidase family protein [Candidatus Omnitrophota bacterium]